jgi:hypothetical protein
MDVDATFKSIQTLHRVISGKTECVVSLTYKGTGYGVTKPWVAYIDARETQAEEYDVALTQLMEMLRKELSDKIKAADIEANRLKQAYKQLGA